MVDAKTFVQKITLMANHKMNEPWRDFLFEHGIWNHVLDLYDKDEVRQSNIICSFIFMAYSPYSNMVHLHKDRIDNKVNILNELGGSELSSEKKHVLLHHKLEFSDFEKDMDDETEVDEIRKDQKYFLRCYLSCVSWYINWHRDSKFKSWVSGREFVSSNITYANTPVSETQEVATKVGVQTIRTPDNVLAFTALKKADLLGKCMLLDNRLVLMDEQLKRKYADLDSVISQEKEANGVDIERFNDNYSPMRMEDRLKNYQNKKQKHD